MLISKHRAGFLNYYHIHIGMEGANYINVRDMTNYGLRFKELDSASVIEADGISIRLSQKKIELNSKV